MYNLADNTSGAVYILDGYNPQTHTFARTIPYLQHLRNPNNLAFYTDEAQSRRGSTFRSRTSSSATATPPAPTPHRPAANAHSASRTTASTTSTAAGTSRAPSPSPRCTGARASTSPRGVPAATTAGSSKPSAPRSRPWTPTAASPHILAHGLRNAVDLRFLPNLDGGALFATNMGDDHLGDKLPEDTFFELDSNDHPGPIAGPQCAKNSACGIVAGVPNYGWPTCYFDNGKPVLDTTTAPHQPWPHRPRKWPSVLHNSKTRDSSLNTNCKPRHSLRQTSPRALQAGTNLAAQARAGQALPDLGPSPRSRSPPAPTYPPAYTTFAAHSSPLGFEYFGQPDHFNLIQTFVVALHGSGHPRIGTGYRLATFTPGNRTPQDFLTGFLTRDGAGKPLIHGRPCGLLRIATDTFLLTDDYLGLVYAIYPNR